MRGQVGELGLGDPLVGRAQVLADVGPEVVDPTLQKLPRQPRRRAIVAGEQPDLLGGPDPVDDRLDRPARQAGQIRVLPALLDPGERQLHAADVRHDLEEIFAQAIAEVAGDPVEERIAAARPAPGCVYSSASRTCRRATLMSGSSDLLPRRHRLEQRQASTARPGSGRPPSRAAAPARSNRRAHHRRSPGSPASIGHRSTLPFLVFQPRCHRSPPIKAADSALYYRYDAQSSG